MSSYRYDVSHAVSPDYPESADGRCYLRVSKNTLTPEGMIRRTPVLEVLGVCAVVEALEASGRPEVASSSFGTNKGSGGDMYAARTAIRNFYGTHVEIDPLVDRTKEVFTGDVIEQIVAAQMSGELPFPDLSDAAATTEVTPATDATV